MLGLTNSGKRNASRIWDLLGLLSTPLHRSLVPGLAVVGASPNPMWLPPTLRAPCPSIVNMPVEVPPELC